VAFSQGDAFGNGIAIQPNGRIVVVGELEITDAHTRFVAIRLKADGALDGSFGNGGRKIVTLPELVRRGGSWLPASGRCQTDVSSWPDRTRWSA